MTYIFIKQILRVPSIPEIYTTNYSHLKLSFHMYQLFVFMSMWENHFQNLI